MVTILVTGATGTIGSRTVRALADKPGVTVRVGARNPAKVEWRTAANVEVVPLDLAQPDTVKAAMVGVDKLYMITPFDLDSRYMGKTLVHAAKDAGVKHVVKQSAFGADAEPGIELGRWHREVEKHLEASGLAWTILRPNNFMDNFLSFYPPQADGNIYLPFGNGAVSWVDARDVAAVAAAVLTTDGHAGRTYTITGPQALTVGQVAEELFRATGRTIRYVDVPEAVARKATIDAGMPEWATDLLMELHAVDKAGYAATVTDDVQRLTGRPPRPFAEFARDHADRFNA